MDWTEFHRRLINAMIVNNHPWSLVDEEYFREFVAWLRPAAAAKMVHSTQLKEKVDLEFKLARERFQEELKV